MSHLRLNPYALNYKAITKETSSQTLVDKEWKEGELEDYSSDVYTPSAENRQASDEHVN